MTTENVAEWPNFPELTHDGSGRMLGYGDARLVQNVLANLRGQSTFVLRVVRLLKLLSEPRFVVTRQQHQNGLGLREASLQNLADVRVRRLCRCHGLSPLDRVQTDCAQELGYLPTSRHIPAVYEKDTRFVHVLTIGAPNRQPNGNGRPP